MVAVVDVGDGDDVELQFRPGAGLLFKPYPKHDPDHNSLVSRQQLHLEEEK